MQTNKLVEFCECMTTTITTSTTTDKINLLLIVTGLPCVPVAQWSDYSHGLQGVMGSNLDRVMCFSSPVTL